MSLVAVLLSTVALGGTPESHAMADCTLRLHETYARIIYLERRTLTRRALSHAEALRQCLPTLHTRRVALALTRRLRERRERWLIVQPVKGKLDSIAACESHGNYRAVSESGKFRGRYQFDLSTWASVGGKGDPAAASPLEQDYRAAMLLKRRGAAPWPVCG